MPYFFRYLWCMNNILLQEFDKRFFRTVTPVRRTALSTVQSSKGCCTNFSTEACRGSATNAGIQQNDLSALSV